MDKMTHAKFNLNNFLMAVANAIDNTANENKHGVKYSSKRVAYTALRLSTMTSQDASLHSDIFSYSIIYNNETAIKNIDKFTFVNDEIDKNKELNEIVRVALFIENNIQIDGSFIVNKDDIVSTIQNGDKYTKEIKESFVTLSKDMTYWLDLTSTCQLPYYIFNYLQDFTMEVEYEKLIELSKVFSDIVYNYTKNENKNNISDKVEELCRLYCFDPKDTARIIIAVNLHNIGDLFIPQYIFTKEDKLTSNEYDIIKSSPYYTGLTIEQIFGFDDINKLSSVYSEKLDGSGYPFCLSANSLSLKHRLIAILTIYQALREKKSYRDSYTHDEAVAILKSDAQQGKLDITVVMDIDRQLSEKE